MQPLYAHVERGETLVIQAFWMEFLDIILHVAGIKFEMRFNLIVIVTGAKQRNVGCI